MGKWTSRGHAHAVHAAFRCKYCSFMLLPAAQTAEALLFYPRCGVCVRHLCEKRGQTLLPIPHILTHINSPTPMHAPWQGYPDIKNEELCASRHAVPQRKPGCRGIRGSSGSRGVLVELGMSKRVGMASLGWCPKCGASLVHTRCLGSGRWYFGPPSLHR